MIRNLKALGVALMAAFAFSAIAAGTAAAGETYTSEVGAGVQTYVTGEKTSNHIFTTGGGQISCTTISFPGEAKPAGPASHEITVTPHYTNCTAFGFATAHITNNGCHYTFTTPTDLGGGKWTIHPPHIVASTGSPEHCFTITPTFFGASVCTQWVPPQTPTGGHIIATNGGGGANPMDVNLETTITGIHYTGTGGSCGDGTTHTDGTYTGNVTVRCYSNQAHTTQVGCTIS